MRRVQKNHTRFTRSTGSQREKRRNQSDLFRRYKGDNNGSLLQTHWLNGLLSRLCWQNYLDSQRFYFHLLVLIGPARFTKSFSQCSVSLSDHSNVCLPSGLQKMSTSYHRKMSDWRKMSVSLSTPQFCSADNLYGVKSSIDIFGPAHELYYVNRFDHHAFSYNLWNSAGDCFWSGTKNEFGFPAEFSSSHHPLKSAKLTYLVSDLKSGFRPQTTQNPCHHLW